MEGSFVSRRRRLTFQLSAGLLTCIALAEAQLAHAGGGSLSEVEDTADFVLDIFSPALLLVLLTLMLIGCGIAVFFGRLSGSMFVKILIGSVFVFGARTIAPKLVALF